jgi:hypothetical protein
MEEHSEVLTGTIDAFTYSTLQDYWQILQHPFVSVNSAELLAKFNLVDVETLYRNSRFCTHYLKTFGVLISSVA